MFENLPGKTPEFSVLFQVHLQLITPSLRYQEPIFKQD